MHKITLMGHVSLDIIPLWEDGRFEELIPGHLIITNGIRFSIGGSVSNTGISLKKLGSNPVLIGKIGDDAVGRLYVESMKAEGKELSAHLIIDKKEHSSYTLILNPLNSDRAFLHYPGANNTFCMSDVNFEALKGSKILHFGYPPVMKKIYKENGNELVKIFNKAHEMGIITSLDMAMPDPNSECGKINWTKFLKNVLPYTDIFLPSVDELLYMIGYNGVPLSEECLHEVSDLMINWGVKILVIKMGENGIYLRTNKIKGLISALVSKDWENRELISPAFRVNVQGTTGTGDASIAGFLITLINNFEPILSISISSAVGAFCAEEIDSTSGIKPLSNVIERMKKGWKRLPMTLKLRNWNVTQNGVILSPRDCK